MTHKIIKTENYLLVVDDSEIKEGDVITDKYNVWIWKDNSSLLGRKKVIAHLPLNNSPQLEGVPLLPPFTRHQEDGIEELAELNGHPESSGFFNYKEGFLDGFLEAKEKYKFTEEDMKRIYEKGYSSGRNELSSRESDEVKYGFIQSLSQPKIPVAFECEWTPMNPYEYTDEEHLKVKPKTTTNSQGQIQWVGEYIY